LPGSLLQRIEDNAKIHNVTYLKNLILRFGLVIEVYRSQQNVHKSVYGTVAGAENSSPIGTIDGIVIGDAFFPADSSESGALTEGYMYTTSDIVRAGDRIEIKRKDSSTSRYKVESVEDLGLTQAVFYKYRISALGD